MSFLRGLLFDNLGLKLAALLLAVLVYLNVYLDRPAEATLSFPVQVTGLGDSLSLSGPVPATVQAQVRGSGKQLLRLRVTEPPYRVPLEGIGPGIVTRQVGAGDLPLAGYEGVEVSHVIGPSPIELRIERKVSRRVPVAPRLEGSVPGDTGRALVPTAEPESVLVTGPLSAVAALQFVSEFLYPGRDPLDHRHDRRPEEHDPDGGVQCVLREEGDVCVDRGVGTGRRSRQQAVTAGLQ